MGCVSLIGLPTVQVVTIGRPGHEARGEHEMGLRAVEQLLERVSSRTVVKRSPPKVITLDPRFLIRDSCSPRLMQATTPKLVRSLRGKKQANRK